MKTAVLVSSLKRRYRQLAAGFCFVLFGVAALIVGGIVAPLAGGLTTDPPKRRRRARRVIRFAARMFWRTMHALGLFRCEMTGVQFLQTERALIVANHPTLIDALLLQGLIDNLTCIAKPGLARNWATRSAHRAAGYIVGEDGHAMVEAAAAELAQGSRVLVFPESTRSAPGAAVVFQRGAAAIATRTNCPVVMVTIHVTEPLLFKGSAWYEMPERVPCFRVVVQPPLDVTPIVRAHRSVALAARDLNARLQAKFDEELAPRGAA